MIIVQSKMPPISYFSVVSAVFSLSRKKVSLKKYSDASHPASVSISEYKKFQESERHKVFDNLSSNVIHFTPRKHKRRHDPGNVYTCGVLGALAKLSFFSQTSIDSKNIYVEMWQLGVLNKNTNIGKKNQVCFSYLSLTVGPVRETSNLAEFFLSLDDGIFPINTYVKHPQGSQCIWFS